MTWEEIKKTPRYELEGLIIALSEYNILHSFDGYTNKHIGEMAKDNPEITKQYAEYQAKQRKYRKQETQVKSLRELF